MATLPMFPLGAVLLPGAVLPLHVFEPRYRKLVQDCLDGDPEFGVALIERGWEVGGGETRTSVGTVARIIQVAGLDDGRYALITVGTRRIVINSWLPDDPYPRADVTDWPDPEPQFSLDEHRVAIERRVRRLLALTVELGDTSTDTSPEIADEVVLASYHLSALAPLGPADHQRLLNAPSVSARYDLLDLMLDDAEAALQFRLGHSSPPDS
jgi:uncharacterized protein